MEHTDRELWTFDKATSIQPYIYTALRAHSSSFVSWEMIAILNTGNYVATLFERQTVL